MSCHYVIDEAGAVIQMVAELARAWHAGVSSWKGERDVNSASIGIESPIPARRRPPAFHRRPDCRDDRARQGHLLTLEHQAGTRAGAFRCGAGAKARPRRAFSRARLAEAKVGRWVEPAPIEGDALFGLGQEGPPIRALQTMLALYGYGVELTGVMDPQTKVGLAAFQRHFRPQRVDGRPDASTIKTLRALIDAL